VIPDKSANKMRQYGLFPEDLPKPSHYELLGVHPSATKEEIKEAYKRLKSIYQPGSLAVYSLFSEEELEKASKALDEAYEVLVDERRREAYNEELIQEGCLNPAELFRREPAVAAERGREVSFQEGGLAEDKGAFPQAKDIYRGEFLRRMRMLKKVELVDISKVTKIRVETLENIEKDNYTALPHRIYLRGFLLEYARYLQLDPIEVANTYLKHYDEWERKQMGR